MKKFILDLLFPINCLECNQEGKFICSACFKKIPINEKDIKFNKDSVLNKLIIASNYSYPLIKKAIHRYKYDFVKELANPLGQLMIKKLNQQNIKDSILIPIPLHLKRLRWRGFNQADLLAQHIGKELNIPVINNLLIRTKHTLPQAKIENAQERQQNIKQAFSLEVRPQKVGTFSKKVPLFRSDLESKTLILIDDISTTGATLKECAKILKPLKPKEIYGLVISKG
ncbi:MAG: hypothetical protein ABIJ60_01245 [Patescibacteria group bacterium]